MKAKDALPSAGCSFEKLIKEKRLYIDKTDLVATLAARGGSYFLSRPGGFGKSLFLSTLKDLFMHGQANFHGLKLAKAGLRLDAGACKVVHLKLSMSEEIGSGRPYEDEFAAYLKARVLKADLAWNDRASCWQEAFAESLHKAPKRSVVILVDDYDAPLNHPFIDLEACEYLYDPGELQERRLVLADFYGLLSSFETKLRLVFITGECPMASLGVFSKAGGIKDLSLEPDFAAVAGFTQDELEQGFRPLMAEAAGELNAWHGPGQWSEQKVFEELKRACFGYAFEPSARHKVYCPVQITTFFLLPSIFFAPPWLRSGRRASLVALLEHEWGPRADIRPLIGQLAKGDVCCSLEDLMPRGINPSNPAYPLPAYLYQKGFVTIKGASAEGLKIGIPNEQARAYFADD